jgi:hypothetical protein
MLKELGLSSVVGNGAAGMVYQIILIVKFTLCTHVIDALVWKSSPKHTCIIDIVAAAQCAQQDIDVCNPLMCLAVRTDATSGMMTGGVTVMSSNGGNSNVVCWRQQQRDIMPRWRTCNVQLPHEQ